MATNRESQGALCALLQALRSRRPLVWSGETLCVFEVDLPHSELWRAQASMVLDKDDFAAIEALDTVRAEPSPEGERSDTARFPAPDLTDRMRVVARECGYAIAVHGSEKRDLDLVAVPWTDEAVEAAWLVDELCEDIPLVVRDNPPEGWPPDQPYLNPEHCPHGRTSWVLLGSSYAYIDLAVMPREHQPAEAQRIARALADWGSPSRRWEDRHPKNQKHWLFVADALMSNHPSIIDPVLAYVRAAKAGRDPFAALDTVRAEPSPEGEPSAEAVRAAETELESPHNGRSDLEITADALRAANAVDFPARSTERAESSEQRTFGLRCPELGPGIHDFVPVSEHEAALAEQDAAAIRWVNAERAEARAEVERLRTGAGAGRARGEEWVLRSSRDAAVYEAEQHAAALAEARREREARISALEAQPCDRDER